MGCGESKSKVEKPERQRQNKEKPKNVDTTIKSPPRGITANKAAPGGKEDPAEETVYPGSYTDKKTKEKGDFMHNIVKQTRHNFIDVSQKATRLDDVDVDERKHRYNKTVTDMVIPKSSRNLHTLPKAAPLPDGEEGRQALVTLLSAIPAVTHQEGQPPYAPFIDKCAKEMSGAIDELEVVEVGKVVLSFEDLFGQ